MAHRGQRRIGTTPVVVLLSLVLGAALLLVAPTPIGRQFRLLVHVDEPHRVLAAVIVRHAGGHYAFEKTQPGSNDPVTYDPCRRIPYELNLDEGPPEALALIDGAIRRISAASGLAFEDRGTTHDTEFQNRKPGEPVLIGFVDRSVLATMTDERNAVGVGGSTAVDEGLGHIDYETGLVALRADWFKEDEVPQPQKEAVVMHELGHVLGLAHVQDTAELMSSRNIGQTTLGPGDREGLALLGQGMCH